MGLVSRARARAALTAALVALACGVVGCRGWDPSPLVAPPPDLPSTILVDLSMANSNAGVTEWVLHAPSAEGDPSAGLDVRAPHIDVLKPDGTRDAWAEAGSARINRVSQDVWARGGVHIHARDGLQVDTDSLQLMSGARRLVTAARVTVRHDGSRLTGMGFDSDSSLRTYRILGQLQAHVVDTSGDFHVD